MGVSECMYENKYKKEEGGEKDKVFTNVDRDPAWKKEKKVLYEWMRKFDMGQKHVFMQKGVEVNKEIRNKRYLRTAERKEIYQFLLHMEKSLRVMDDKQKGNDIQALNITTSTIHPRTLIEYAGYLEEKYPVRALILPLMRRVGMDAVRFIKFKIVFKQK